jgi:hypothetical protein
MTNEEKKAIERMKNVYVKNVHTFHDELGTVLNLIKKQQKEIGKLHNIMEKLNEEKEKNKRIKELESDNYECNNIIVRYMEELEIKDKMIDLMSEHLTTPIHSKKDVVEYFENLAKESGEIDENNRIIE